MSNKILTEIIGICLELDTKASALYLKLSHDCKIEELKSFWNKMHNQEEEHVAFWENLLSMAKDDIFPRIFDAPETTKKELEIISKKVDALLAQFEISPNIPDTFFLAYRMEFYLLHPSLETLFHFAKRFSSLENPEDTYTSHLNEFIETLGSFGFLSKELEFLGEATQVLWKRNKELVIQGSMDELTGISNRRGFFDTIKPLSHLAKRNKESVAILMADIDDFKKVNDTYGHQKGDAVLKTVASIIKSHIRGSDVAGRYGGEEFIVYFDGINEDSVKDVAEKLRKTVEEDATQNIPVTISLGVAVGEITNNVDDCIYSLIKTADACLYDAKNSGKNKVVIKKET